MRPRDLGLQLARALDLARQPRGVPVTIESINELNARLAAAQRTKDELRERSAQQLAANLREEPACTKHGWGFGSNVKPAPPASLCPKCARELRAADRAHEHEHETREISIWGGCSTKAGLTPLAVRLWDEKQEAEFGKDGVAENGNIRPGSEAEQSALEIVADTRGEHRAELRDTPTRRRARARRYWGKRFNVPAGDANWRRNVNAVHSARR
jgi:hypothetical protein